MLLLALVMSLGNVPPIAYSMVITEEQPTLTVPNVTDGEESNLPIEPAGVNGSVDVSEGRNGSGDIPVAPTVPLLNDFNFFFPVDCILIALESFEFTYVNEEEVFFRGETKRVQFWTASDKPVVCSNFTQNGTSVVNITTNVTTFNVVFPKGFAITSYLGCSLSVVGSFFLLMTYSLFKELRTLPSLLLMSLTVAFLVGDLLILLGSSLASLSESQSRAPCIAVAILLHYFFLARFCWTNVIAFEMVRSFTAATKLLPVISSSAKRTIFIVYSVIGWGVPLVITLICVILNFTVDSFVRYGTETCWINDVNSAIAAFVAPLVLSLSFNIISFIWIVFNLCKSTLQNRTGKKPQLNVRLYVAVFTVMGLTWIFGFIAILTRSSWAWYPFIVLNSTQALAVSFSFTCSKKIAGNYFGLLSHDSVVTSSSIRKSNTGKSSKVSPTTT